ncbi:conserved membrane spanning protein [Deinococcus marmoris]|uniref:Conserved membrane spanning protein n=1 Tax=Deinococcus marmoris TaxID=249408 RepID=A0A1U7NRS1_9DEIO|nr:conserved membrane spanning protein [Deinococcus marmoris]
MFFLTVTVVSRLSEHLGADRYGTFYSPGTFDSMRRRLQYLWLALIPVVPLVAPLAFGALASLRRLPRPWLALISVFVFLQVIAATLTPDPLVSVPLAFLRAAYTVALITAGFVLGSAGALRPALIGYGVVAVTAFITTLSIYGYGPQALGERLAHPYYTSVSLGLAGTLGLLLAITWKGGPLAWRVLGGGLSLGLFLWSGSRGPLIALTAGLLAVLATSFRIQWKATLLTVGAAAALVFALQGTQGSAITGRFMENALNGRDAFWTDALDTARAHPWGGVGPYQLGPHLSTQYHQGDTNCSFWLKEEVYGLKSCPAIVNRFRGAWLIAHNTAFHLLGESGVIGLSGWLALMGALALAAWRSGDPLVNALTWAAAGMGLVDNPTLLPNLGHAELYWLASGIGVSLAHDRAVITGEGVPPSLRLQSFVPFAPLLACILLGYFASPTWWERIRPGHMPLPVLEALTLPTHLRAGESVTVFMRVKVAIGHSYRLTGLACGVEQNCELVLQKTFSDQTQEWTTLNLKGLPAGRYKLTLKLSVASPGISIQRSLAEIQRVIRVE